MLSDLGYEQMRALTILAATPNLEGSSLCKQADCSWDELFQLAEKGLIDIGEERLFEKQLHPQLTNAGRHCVAEIENRK